MDERTLSDWSVSRSANEPGSAAGAVTHTVRVTSTGDEDSVSFQCGINVVNGKTYPPSCGQQRWDMLDAGMQGRDRPSDVIIITYPKCGTTWAEQAALLLLNGGDKELLNPAHKNTYIPGANDVGKIWVEAAVLQEPSMGQRAGGEEFVPVTWAEFDSAPAPRVIKSHTRCKIAIYTPHALSTYLSSHLLNLAQCPLPARDRRQGSSRTPPRSQDSGGDAQPSGRMRELLLPCLEPSQERMALQRIRGVLVQW